MMEKSQIKNLSIILFQLDELKESSDSENLIEHIKLNKVLLEIVVRWIVAEILDFLPDSLKTPSRILFLAKLVNYRLLNISLIFQLLTILKFTKLKSAYKCGLEILNLLNLNLNPKHRKVFSRMEKKFLYLSLLLDEEFQLNENIPSIENINKYNSNYRLKIMLEDTHKKIVFDLLNQEEITYPINYNESFNSCNDHLLEEIKKRKNIEEQLYLIIKACATGLECSKRIMKQKIASKAEIADAFIKIYLNEKIYNQYYNTIIENLVESSKDWKYYFQDVIVKEFENLDNKSNHMLDLLSKLTSLLLINKMISWKFIDNIELSPESTTPVKRVFLMYLFKDLVREVGINELVKILCNEIINGDCNFLGIFPPENSKFKKYSNEYFKNIGLPELLKVAPPKPKKPQEPKKTKKIII